MVSSLLFVASGEIRKKLHPVDIIAMCVVPLALAGVFYLPIGLRQSLAFEYNNPTLLTAFASNYVHFTRSHLVSNLAGYFILVATSYVMSVSDNNRQNFYLFYGLAILVFPVVLSYLNLAIPRRGIAFGFSGLNMVIFGFLIIEFTIYVENIFGDRFGVEFAPLFFFVSSLAIAVPHTEYVWSLVVVVVSVAMVAVYLLSFAVYGMSVTRIVDSLKRSDYPELSLVVGALWVAFVSIAFPTNPVVEDGVINVYSHFLGFSVSFIVGYIWILMSAPDRPETG